MKINKTLMCKKSNFYKIYLKIKIKILNTNKDSNLIKVIKI